MMDNSRYDALKLENQMCFPLYACSREIVKRYKPFLDKIDLTYTQYIAMMVMWEKKCVNVKEIVTITAEGEKLKEKAVDIPFQMAGCTNLTAEEGMLLYRIEELFFDGAFDTPLTKEKAESLAIPLEMIRLAPSAVNKQPWRVVVVDNTVHFYLKRSKGFSKEGKLDMQMIDMGIALCHFALAARTTYK